MNDEEWSISNYEYRNSDSIVWHRASAGVFTHNLIIFLKASGVDYLRTQDGYFWFEIRKRGHHNESD